ncbi:MAG TPA: 23S rRNA (adenine(2503)-C(2))-methyltransferase RlmN [Candidatus Onthovivens sp.]|nr:23S rRNA (adenine(2503)-C(2))-methyltransferase RlmN [Candidatus Onthovivens sp.]
MINLYGVSLEKLEEKLVNEEGQKKFRATQLFKWIYGKKVQSFDEMSDVSLSFREILKEKYTLEKDKIFQMQKSNDGTIKLLLELADGNKVETVLMRYNYGNVVCVSSQVGCDQGCAFCASGLLKKKRNLEVHELVSQVLVINDLLFTEDENSRVTHVVVMGTGEPFDNYDNVLDFIKILNHPFGLAIGARHITVSTCGLIEGIKRYANEGIQINLAISLHAPSNELRNKLMPINFRYPLEEVIEACRYYEKVAGRRVTFEYIMLKDFNDTKECAYLLANLIKGMLSYVNLIPYNPVNELKYKRSDYQTCKEFLNFLTQRGVTATIRREFGSDIDAACGQLRAKNESKI